MSGADFVATVGVRPQLTLLEQSDEVIAADMASRAALRRQSDQGSPRHRSDRVRVYRADHARDVFRDGGVFFRHSGGPQGDTDGANARRSDLAVGIGRQWRSDQLLQRQQWNYDAV